MPLKNSIVFILSGLLLWSACGPRINPEESIVSCDYRDVNKIVLEQGQHSLLLRADEEGRFKVNEKELADTAVIHNLLSLPGRLLIKTPAPKSESDSLQKMLSNNGLSIRYMQDDKILCAWVLGEFSPRYEAAPLQNEGAKTIFYAELPGGAFNPDEYCRINPDFFIDRRVIDLEYFEISQVAVRYFNADSTHSFRLTVFSDSAQLFDHQNKLLQPIDLKSVGQYLNYFRDIRYYRSSSNLSPEEEDSVLRSRPLCELQITDTDGQKTHLRIFPITEGDDRERLHQAFLQVNGRKRLRVIKYYALDLLCKTPKYFQTTVK